MKLVSQWEPWATLMAIGAKRIETRGWGTDYRGWLAIHACKGGLNRELLQNICFKPFFYQALMLRFAPFSEQVEAQVRHKGWISEVFPHGKIVAVVNLLDAPPIDPGGICLSGLFDEYPELDTPQERAFGNYDDPGRYGLVTDQVFRLPEPIPFTSRQGKLLDVPLLIEAQIRQQWAGGK